MKTKLELACLELLKAIGRNSTNLWNPDLKDVTECIVRTETEVSMDLDNPDIMTKFSGVEVELKKIEAILESENKPKNTYYLLGEQINSNVQYRKIQ